ncbi:MAG: dihydrofolate reductase [Devosia sp.]|nr:dihydrofolate reductase [Devosia sp.]
MSIEIVGHAIVCEDGMIADHEHQMPAALRNDADWRRFQAELDRTELVVLGRLGHEAHPNPGRRRLVLTSRAAGLVQDPADPRAMLWNPAMMAFEAVLAELGIAQGTIAVTGGTRVFDLFLHRFTRFDLVEVAGIAIPDGVPCFSGGYPQDVLTAAGLRLVETVALDPGVTLLVWSREL